MSSFRVIGLVKWRRALVLGAAAGAAVILVMSAVGPLFGIDSDLCLPIGAALGSVNWTALTGCIAQLIIGALGGVVYALVFEFVTQRATWWVGLLMGIGHACVAGIGVAYLFVWRQPVEGITVPGGFMLFRGGAAALVLVLAHVAYGTILGAGYGRVLHAPAPTTWRVRLP